MPVVPPTELAAPRAVQREMYLRATWLLLVLIAAATGARHCRADQMPALVSAALGERPADPEHRCAYTRTRIEDDHSKSERFHPDDSKTPWTLEAVNGRPPTEAERRRFAKDAGEHDRAHPLGFDLEAMVLPGSWQELRQNDRQAVFQFKLRPTDDIPARVADKAVGTLVVDKSRPQPVRATIENTGSASIAPFVRVNDFSQKLRFHWDEDLHTPVLAEMETRWQGRAFGLKKLGKHETLRYSDYVCRAMNPGQRGEP